MSVEVMKQALDALELALSSHGVMLLSDPPQDAWKTRKVESKSQEAITALRAAIEQGEKPMAWFHADNYKTRFTTDPSEDMIGRYWQPLYTAPREWVELTDDEARALVNRATFGDKTNWQALVYMVDAKLKERNA